MLYCNGDFFFSESQTNNMSQHHSLFQSHVLHSFDEFVLYGVVSRSSVWWVIFHQAHWGYLVLKDSALISAEVEKWGFNCKKKKTPPDKLSLFHSANQLPSLFSPSLPACDWPFTFRRPVTFRHPLWRPLMWCLLLCTVGVNHTPWESNVEFHTMGPLACVFWGLKRGIRD